MKKNFLLAFMATAILFACDKAPQEEQMIDPLTQDQTKVKLTEIGQKACAMADVSKQQELIETITDGIALYKGVPEAPPVLESKAILKFAQTANPYELLAAVEPTTITQISDYFANYIYNEDTQEFEITENKDAAIVRFKSHGQDVVATLTASEEVYDLILDYSNENSADVALFRIPKKVNATIVRGKKTLLSLEMNNVYEKNVVASVGLSLTATSYKVALLLNATNQDVSLNVDFKIDGEQFIKNSASMKGNDLINVDVLISDMPEISSLVLNAEILDLKLNAEATDINEFIEKMNKLQKNESYTEFYPSWTETKECMDQAAPLINSHLKANATYGYSTPFAEIFADVSKYQSFYWDAQGEKHNYDAYTVTPVFKFLTDGAEADFESFFAQQDFEPLLKQLQALITAWEDALGISSSPVN